MRYSEDFNKCVYLALVLKLYRLQVDYRDRAPSQYPKRRLSVRSRKVSKPRDWYFKLSYRFEIWQAHRQQRCRSACQISERSDNAKYKSLKACQCDLYHRSWKRWRLADKLSTPNASIKINATHHYNDVMMSVMASQITSLTIVYSTVYSGANLRKCQSSASLALVGGIHWWPVNSPHKGLKRGKCFHLLTSSWLKCILVN